MCNLPNQRLANTWTTTCNMTVVSRFTGRLATYAQTNPSDGAMIWWQHAKWLSMLNQLKVINCVLLAMIRDVFGTMSIDPHLRSPWDEFGPDLRTLAFGSIKNKTLRSGGVHVDQWWRYLALMMIMMDAQAGMAYLNRQLQQVIGRILSGQWRASRMCLWWMQTPTFGDWSQRPPGGLEQTALSPHLDLVWFLRRRLLQHVAATLEALNLCATCRHQNALFSIIEINLSWHCSKALIQSRRIETLAEMLSTVLCREMDLVFERSHLPWIHVLYWT